jgi:HEAT repeat protein
MNAWGCLSEEFCARLTLTLVHFLWQGTLLALVAGALAATVMRRTSPRLRYGAFVATLLLMAACPFVTCALVGSSPGEAALQAPVAPPAKSSVDTEVPSEAAQAEGSIAQSNPDETTPSVEPPSVALSSAAAPVQVTVNQTAHPLEPLTDLAAGGPSQFRRAFASAVAGGAVMVRRGDWRVYAPSIALAYFAGTFLMLGRLLVALRGGRRLRRNAERVTDAGMLEALSRQAKALGLAFTPVVASCGRVVVPTVVGVLRPMILIPVSVSTGLTLLQLELLLRHELAHICRYDHLVNILQRLVEALLFFHPAVWWVSRRIRIEREHCCDDLVLAAGGEAMAYAESLVHMAELGRAQAEGQAFASALSAAGGRDGRPDRPSQLRRRILRILEGPMPHLRLTGSGSLAVMLAASVFLLAIVGILAPNKTPSVVAETAEVGQSEEEALPEADAEPDPETATTEDADSASASANAPQEGASPDAAPESLPPPPTDDPRVKELWGQLQHTDWWLRKIAAQQMGEERNPVFVEALVPALTDSDARVRIAAAEALGKIGAPSCIEALTIALKDENDAVREAVADALAKINDPKVMRMLRLAVNDDYPPLHEAAAKALAAIGSPEAVALLIEALNHPLPDQFEPGRPVRLVQPPVRPRPALPPRFPGGQEQTHPELPWVIGEVPPELSAPVVAALAGMAPDVVVEPLVKAIQHENHIVRMGAVLALGGVQDERSREALLRALDGADADVRKAGLQVLWNFEGEEVTEALEQALMKDPQYDDRSIAVAGLQRRGDIPENIQAQAAYHVLLGNWDVAATFGGNAVGPLMDALQSKDSNARVQAAGILQKIGDPRAIEPLAPLLTEPEDSVRYAAVSALAAIGGEGVVEPLTQALKDSNAGAREMATQGLGACGDPRAVEPLCATLKDLNSEVRGMAAKALGQLADSRAVEPLVAALCDEDEEVQVAVADALGKLRDQRAVEPLCEALLRTPPTPARRPTPTRDNLWLFHWTILSALEAIGGRAVVEGLARRLPEISDAPLKETVAQTLARVRAAAGGPAAPPPASPPPPPAPPLPEETQDRGEQPDEAAPAASEAAPDASASNGVAGFWELLNQLKDDDWWLRQVAAEKLGEAAIQDAGMRSNAVDRLIAALKDKDQRVKQAAAGALGKRGDPRAIKHLVAALKEGDAVRDAAAEALTKFDDPSVVELLRLALYDGEFAMQMGAIEALVKMNPAQAVPMIIAGGFRLGWGDLWDFTANTLSKFKPEEVTGPLVEATRSENVDVARGAIRVLGNVGGSQAKETLLALAQRADSPVRRDAVAALAGFADDDVTQALGGLLADSDITVWDRAGQVLGQRNYTPPDPEKQARLCIATGQWQALLRLGPAATEPLQGMLSSQDPASHDRRLSAATSLGSLADPRAVDTLAQLLQDQERDVRVAAVEGLARIAVPETIPALSQATRDADAEVRTIAVDALGQMKDGASYEVLAAALGDPVVRVRVKAASALAALDDPRALEPLAGALTNEAAIVVSAAATALERLCTARSNEVPAVFDGLGTDKKAAIVESLMRFSNIPRSWGRGPVRFIDAAFPCLYNVSLELFLRALDDADPGLRRKGVEAIAVVRQWRFAGAPTGMNELRVPEAVARIAANEAEDPAVRRMAIESVGQHRAGEAADALMGILGRPVADPQQSMLQEAAARALLAIGDPKTVPAVRTWLDGKPEEGPFQEIRNALSQFAPGVNQLEQQAPAVPAPAATAAEE